MPGSGSSPGQQGRLSPHPVEPEQPRRYYALLAGSHPTLPLAELRGILDAEASYWRLLAHHTQLAVFEAAGVEAERIIERAGFVEEIGLLLVYTEADRLLEELRVLEPLPGVYRVEVRRLRGYSRILYPDDSELRMRIVGLLESRGWRLSPTRYTGVLRVILEEGVAVVGVMLARLKVGVLRDRWPHRRPFYKPGALDPRMARLFVNLSRASRRSIYLDPFCGTGGFAIEALLSARVREALCGDLDRAMAEGAPVNLKRYARGLLWHASRWDARRLPIRDSSIDSIGTDTPYGRLTTTGGLRVEEIIEGFLSEAVRVLRKGGWAAFACPHWVDCPRLASRGGLRVEEVHYMRVHGSLTRIIVVARRV